MTFVVESPRSADAQPVGERDLVIALVNNMPDSALRATEVQFASLLAAGAGDHDVRLRRYTLPAVPREVAAAAHIADGYFPIGHLRQSPPAAVIITGSDPRELVITDEPYWDDLVDVLTWAESNTASMIASCLSAHALLLVDDSIERRRFLTKCSGIYHQDVRSGSALTSDLPARISMPHSRHNDVEVDAVRARGYDPLVSSDEVGWTIATRESDSCLIVLMQGHPEYEAITLLLEYRRDVRRYLLGERPVYPPIPAGYFSARAEDAMLHFRDEALAAPESTVAMVERFPFDLAENDLPYPWRSTAEIIYTNWVNEVARRVRTPEVADAR
jgi:homoserine O-succinyltransferase